jgi:hypothetical protein
MGMITKDSIAEAYSFFHQKWNLYQLIDKEPVKDHIEYTISSYAEAMNAELYEKIGEGKSEFLHDHSTFPQDLSNAVDRLEKLL